MLLDDMIERINRKELKIDEIEMVLRDYLASAAHPAQRARLREALAVAEHIANRGGTRTDWDQLIHYIAVADWAIKSGAY